MNTFNQEWECTDCGWHGHEDDLKSECVFHATQEEPAEYAAWCPECGDNWENFIEYEEPEEPEEQQCLHGSFGVSVRDADHFQNRSK